MKLYNCPLCIRKTRVSAFIDDRDVTFKVGCGACGCSTPNFKTEKRAIIFWNKRFKSPELGHCPFCNNKPELVETYYSSNDPWYQLKCNHCGFSSGTSKDKQLIINKFNGLN